ncbi:MAG TPA: DUF1992 domain-containing protein [Marmoricola sp.]|nr:DUF1992 domain-containing protein [Marmoricola sp.]
MNRELDPEEPRPAEEESLGDRLQRQREERRAERAAARARIAQQESWVDLQVRQAMERGEFDHLPGKGKPIEGLTGKDDPDWWVRRLVERERITGVLPPSLQLRKEDAELDGRLDRLGGEAEVRREVEEFNDRVKWALYRPPEGPPMVTRRRDPATEVARWEERRLARRRATAEAAARRRAEEPEPGTERRPWWRRRRRRLP